MQYTFHVVGLPHTQTTHHYNCCAYTGKVIRFCKMMKDLGHKVFLYGSEHNDAVCDEFIPCIPKMWGPEQYLEAPFDPVLDHWITMNLEAIRSIRDRIKHKDFICLIAGRCQQAIAEAFPANMAVEFGVGYSGTFSKFKVFESYAWMHMMYGAAAQGRDPGNVDGNFYDTVIPNYYNRAEFCMAINKEDYFAYLGRLEYRKGWHIAQSVCEKMGARLLVAGPGKFEGYGEYLGVLNDLDKVKLLARAQAVFCPSLYIEPFCGVMAEAQLCGTPVIASPWGSFSENIIPGRTGFLCHTFAQFQFAAKNIGICLPSKDIRDIAIEKFSMAAVSVKYQEYFTRLHGLWERGWDAPLV